MKRPLDPVVGGLYCIRCFDTRKAYVGSSFSVHDRIKNHFYALNGKRHHNVSLQQDYDRFGKVSFSSTVLAIHGSRHSSPWLGIEHAFVFRLQQTGLLYNVIPKNVVVLREINPEMFVSLFTAIWPVQIRRVPCP